MAERDIFAKERMKLAIHKQANNFFEGLAEAFAPKSLGQALGTAAVGVGTTLAVAGLTEGGSTAFQAVADKVKKPLYFKRMLAENAPLRDADRAQVQKGFNALYALNPDYASEPTLAASFVANVLNSGGPSQSPTYISPEKARSVMDASGGRLSPITESAVRAAQGSSLLQDRLLEGHKADLSRKSRAAQAVADQRRNLKLEAVRATNQAAIKGYEQQLRGYYQGARTPTKPKPPEF